MLKLNGGVAPSGCGDVGSRPDSKFVRFVVADLDGQAYEVTPDDFGACPALKEHVLLRQFVANELGRKEDPGATAVPRHVTSMRRHELVDYCEVSEKGHHKWYPKGLLIQRLILDYGAQVAREWGA